MKQKKRTKRYNPVKGLAAMSAFNLRGKAIWYSHKDRGEKYSVSLIDIDAARVVEVTECIANQISKIKYNWCMTLMCTGEESNGKRRLECQDYPLKEKLYHYQLTDVMNDEHDALAAEFEKRNTLTNVSWLAVPSGCIVSREQIENILNKFKAW